MPRSPVTLPVAGFGLRASWTVLLLLLGVWAAHAQPPAAPRRLPSPATAADAPPLLTEQPWLPDGAGAEPLAAGGVGEIGPGGNCPAPMRMPSPCDPWLRRPWSFGWFGGMTVGSMLINDWIGMKEGASGGFRLGWDANPTVGGEMRFVFGSVEVFDRERAKQAQWDADTAAGYAPDDLWRHRFDNARNAELFQWDFDLLYYPLGETRFRPYLMAGVGLTNIHFFDRLSHDYNRVNMSLPIGGGVKYLLREDIALRVDCIDDIALGGGNLNTLHVVSLSGGVEIRFGGSRRAYWPWNPSRWYW